MITILFPNHYDVLYYILQERVLQVIVLIFPTKKVTRNLWNPVFWINIFIVDDVSKISTNKLSTFDFSIFISQHVSTLHVVLFSWVNILNWLKQSHICLTFILINYSSSIECASLCILTSPCSAFEFKKETQSCNLGSKAGLVMAQPSDSEAQLTKITIIPEGKQILEDSLLYFTFNCLT